jgi:hypothetical protein
MSNINDEMKAAANYTIKMAKEKFGQELDFSEQSIVKLENLLEQAYQSLSSRVKDEKTSNSISRTANAWGSYLGEIVRQKWGGKWVQRGSERMLHIKNIEFSPIGFVYQKITSHPEYSAKKYFAEVERKISPPPVISSPQQKLSENIGQPQEQISAGLSQDTVTIDKKLILTMAGIGGTLIVIVACIVGFMFFNKGRAEFKSNLNAFLTEAEKLNVMTEQGVSFQEFRTQLIEVKSSYASIDSWPLSYQDEQRSFELAIKGWDYTLEIWNFKLAALGLSEFNGRPDYEGIEGYLGLGENDTFENLDEEIGQLMLQAGIHYETGKEGVK